MKIGRLKYLKNSVVEIKHRHASFVIDEYFLQMGDRFKHCSRTVKLRNAIFPKILYYYEYNICDIYRTYYVILVLVSYNFIMSNHSFIIICSKLND